MKIKSVIGNDPFFADNKIIFQCENCKKEFITFGRTDKNFYNLIKGEFCYCPSCHFNGFREKDPNFDGQLTFF